MEDRIEAPKPKQEGARTEVLALRATLKGHEDRVWSAAWDANGSRLATCGGDKTIRLWTKDSTGMWTLLQVLDGAHTRTVRNVTWSPCGNYLASAGFDGVAAIWEKSESGYEVIATLEGHSNEVKCIAWSPNGNLIATCSRDKSIWIWECEEDGDYACVSVLNGHTQDVKFIQWHPSGTLLFSCSYDNTIRIWIEDPSDDDWMCIHTISGGHSSTVWQLAFDPNSNGDRFVSCSDDKALVTWVREDVSSSSSADVSSSSSAGGKAQSVRSDLTIAYKAESITPVGCRTLYGVDWSKDGYIAVASGDNSIRVFAELPSLGSEKKRKIDDRKSASKGQTDDSMEVDEGGGGGTHAATDETGDVKSPALESTTPMQGCSGASSEENKRKERATPQLELMAMLKLAHKQDVNSVRWNPKHSRTLASVSDDFTVKLWQIQLKNAKDCGANNSDNNAHSQKTTATTTTTTKSDVSK